MDRELEIAAVASLGGWLKKRPKVEHAVALGTPCANCATPLRGPYCHHCGQLAEDFHRSIGHLVEETVENLLHLDGRIWRTLPRLVLKPAGLTRDYLEGRRAGQIPPLRLFLVVVLLFFLAGGLIDRSSNVSVKAPAAGDMPIADIGGAQVMVRPLHTAGAPKILQTWFLPRVLYAQSHHHEFSLILESWAHRFAILLLPVTALMMGVLFAFQRRFFLYDHLIFSMHSLSFMGLLLSINDVLGALGVIGAVTGLLSLVMPVHLFVHMRGVYRTSIFGTLARMTLLFVMTCVVLLIGIALLVLVGLAGLPTGAAA
ncbi:MAG TPA: DUF3667 domain-containing protein [Caulobacteraceae bacterium]|nr:DUF3667 domain-containing protein [Caulobacteraceae bacterium]